MTNPTHKVMFHRDERFRGTKYACYEWIAKNHKEASTEVALKKGYKVEKV